MRILSLPTSAALLGLSVVMAQANDCQSLQLSDGAAFTALSSLCNVGYPGGYGARQVEKMAPQVPFDTGGTAATSIRTYQDQRYDKPFDPGYYDLAGNRYDSFGNLIAAAAPTPSKFTNTAPPAPAPPPEGYHYETFVLKPNSLGLKEGVRLVPDADNFGPQSTPTKETGQKPKDDLDGQPMRAQSTFGEQPKPNLTPGNSAKPTEKNAILATPGNVPQTPVPDHKPLVAGDSKTSAPKDGTKVAAQSTPTTPPPAPSGYHYEIFPLSPNSPASFKGKEGVRLVPNADNFGPLPNASSTNATVDKLNPGLSGLPVRAPSTFPDPAKANPVRGNSATASERDDILDRVRAQVTATSERLKLFGVTEKMITDGAVACGISGAAGCAGYAAAEYIHKLGHENDRLAAEANAISSKDPNAQAKLDRIYGRLGAIDRRIGQIETTVVVGRDGAIGCVTGGPAGCVLGASESAAWLTAEKYAPPGYAEKIRTAKAIRDVGGILYKGVKGGTEGFPLPNGETVKGFEGTALALSKETAIKALKEATQFEGAQTGKSAPTATPAPNGTSASTDKSQPEGKSQSAGKSQLTEKSQLTANPQPSEKPQPAAKYVHPTVTEFQQPRVIQAAFRQPGGISLTKAAAERMALNIDIDAITYRNGQIIIAGAQNAANKIDAALFLTAMRLACTPGDPFFSLDPVDGRAWQEQSRAAMDAAWKQVESSIKARLRSPFDVKTFSVQRDFAAVWAKMGSQYPELRAELVFRPEWLRETRFGEILYKADVLLKELTVGIPVVTPGGPARMADIPGYIAPYKRGAARGLLVSKQTERQGWQGHRLWFDLMSQAGPDGPPAYEDPDASIDRNSNRALYATLKQRGFVDPPRPQPLQESRLYVENGIADISGVFPKMFILKHDAATGRDVPGASPDLDLLSADVNKRTALYASAYQELRDLTGIFRAYIASTKIVKEEPDVCAKLPDELTGGERVPSAMPEFHPSELFITAAYAVGSSAYQYSTSSSVSGGISLRGKQYYQQAVIEKETPLIAEIKRDLSAGVPLPEFKSTSGRQYLAFDTRELPRKIPIAAQ